MDFKKVFVIAISVIACLLVIGWVKSSNDHDVEKAESSESAISAIMTRSSVRKFQNLPIGKDTVEIILKAAMAAPTAMNKQPWAFIVVDDKTLLKELADSLPNVKMAADAAFAVIACGDTTKMLEGDDREYWINDVSAATENMLIAVNALKLGAVWTGLYPNGEKVEKARKVLRIPPHLIPVNIIPVGHPAETPEVKDKWKAENVFYNAFKDEKTEKK